MRKMLTRPLATLLTAFLAFSGIVTVQADDAARPPVSEKPYGMMQKLALLEGRWTMTTEMTEDNGESWQAFPASEVDLHLRHKGMILAEIPADTASPGFHMETYISFDQYRNVYRKAAIDDVWGIMDMYEGTLEGDAIVFTNLKSGTTFPVGDGIWRNFRLTLELKSPTRMLHIEKSDDGGASWQKAFRITYRKEA
ncbi:DUF1579 family protein [Kordiimonas lacus]|uniref:DUF1579 domain-containing protein n=1 Tax=Kordiimonas lacus TaxID=637679 RepID=A0A1G7CRD9_9PROT|nr:DUF1579 family protein [Kordiimonas lacus]SDE41994.1 Protein of unknown function [Kordiimonas lacus]